MLAHGALHSATCDANLLRFDIEKEEYGLIDGPLPGITMCTLVALRGSLCIADLSFTDQVEIWVMKDYERREWIRKYRIPIKAASGKENNRDVNVVGQWEGGEIFMINQDGYFSYNSEIDQFTRVHVLGFKHVIRKVEFVTHIGSLIQI